MNLTSMNIDTELTTGGTMCSVMRSSHACTPSLDLSAQLTWTGIGTRRAAFAQLSAGQSEAQEGSTEEDNAGGVNNVLSFLWPRNLNPKP